MKLEIQLLKMHFTELHEYNPWPRTPAMLIAVAQKGNCTQTETLNTIVRRNPGS